MSSLAVAEHLADVLGVVGAPDQTPLPALLDPPSRLESQTRDVLQLWAVADKVGGRTLIVRQGLVDSE